MNPTGRFSFFAMSRFVRTGPETFRLKQRTNEEKESRERDSRARRFGSTAEAIKYKTANSKRQRTSVRVKLLPSCVRI